MLSSDWSKIIKQKYTDPKDFPRDTPVQSIFRKILWFLCTARNAVVIVAVSLVAFGMDRNAESKHFTLTGEIKSGLPPFRPPPFSQTYWVDPDTKKHIEFKPQDSGHHRRRREQDLERYRRDVSPVPVEHIENDTGVPQSNISGLNLTASNESLLSNITKAEPVATMEEGCRQPAEGEEAADGCVQVKISAGLTISKLMAGIFIVSIMGYVESIAIAKGFARKFGYKIDPGQELVAIGLCNIASAFVSRYRMP